MKRRGFIQLLAGLSLLPFFKPKQEDLGELESDLILPWPTKKMTRKELEEVYPTQDVVFFNGEKCYC